MSEVEVPIWVITSGSEECLERLKSILLYEGMEVQSSGMHYRLVMPLNKWKELGEGTQGFVQDYAAGFALGWEEGALYDHEWTKFGE